MIVPFASSVSALLHSFFGIFWKTNKHLNLLRLGRPVAPNSYMFLFTWSLDISSSLGCCLLVFHFIAPFKMIFVDVRYAIFSLIFKFGAFSFLYSLDAGSIDLNQLSAPCSNFVCFCSNFACLSGLRKIYAHRLHSKNDTSFGCILACKEDIVSNT